VPGRGDEGKRSRGGVFTSRLKWVPVRRPILVFREQSFVRQRVPCWREKNFGRDVVLVVLLVGK